VALVKEILEWFSDNCNGDWEHQNGFSIESLDNPGVAISVDLAPILMIPDKIILSDLVSENSWISIRIKNDKFLVACSVDRFEEAIKNFSLVVAGKFSE
jgi:immunity protein 53 of polymorphic toxin system